MNFTKEQLDVLIAALEAQRAQIPQEPQVKWIVLDRDGDRCGGGQFDKEADARLLLLEKKRIGSFAPYTLYRCEPVA